MFCEYEDAPPNAGDASSSSPAPLPDLMLASILASPDISGDLPAALASPPRAPDTPEVPAANALCIASFWFEIALPSSFPAPNEGRLGMLPPCCIRSAHTLRG